MNADQVQKINELSQKYQIQNVFPFVGQISQFHNEYENVTNEVFGVKKKFGEKKGRLGKGVVGEIRVREGGVVVNENVTFDGKN